MGHPLWGGTLVYEAYNLNSIEFGNPKSSYSNEVPDVDLPDQPRTNHYMLQDRRAAGLDVSQDDVMECNLDELLGMVVVIRFTPPTWIFFESEGFASTLIGEMEDLWNSRVLSIRRARII